MDVPLCSHIFYCFFTVPTKCNQFYRANFNYISFLNIIYVHCEIIKVHITITNNAKNSYHLTFFMQNGFFPSFNHALIMYV